MSPCDRLRIHSTTISQTILVTDGTAGICYEVARAFAESHARVLLLSLEVENGDRVVAEIKKAVSDQADVHFVECDLGDLKNVKKTGDSIREKGKRLDIVCHIQSCYCSGCSRDLEIVADAGIGVNTVSSDGLDRHFAVSHLNRFLLINRLLPLMRKISKLADAPAPRIVSISSELHRMAPSSIQFASKEVMEVGSKNLSAVSLYTRTELANICGQARQRRTVPMEKDTST
jgi:NAD(P)-dependent dehydrogenase (short-subunit alcohol dehydrogenase family)